jgi:phosphoglycerol transferase MdoB-like AlkP superfamily enzyme
MSAFRPPVTVRQVLRTQLVLSLFFWAVLLCFKVLFAVFNWPGATAVQAQYVRVMAARAVVFHGATLAYVLAPLFVLAYLLASTGWRSIRLVLVVYAAVAAALIAAVSLADLQYFEESGKHITYEATAYLGAAGLPILRSAFDQHPWLCWSSVVAMFGLSGTAATVALRATRTIEAAQTASTFIGLLLSLSATALLFVIVARGGLSPRPLSLGDAVVSPDPYLNGLVLDAVYGVGATLVNAARPGRYADDDVVPVVQRLIFNGETSERRTDYPLLRVSPGTPAGNRKNVVLFILESWTGQDVGALGGEPGVTPYFDELARQGVLFDRFFAAGVRSAEGIFSSLCSFPNPPGRPVLHERDPFSRQWRCLGDILAEAGYENVFIHGRDLEFDHVRSLLQLTRFRRVIERSDFGADVPIALGRWAGYDDASVMRRAHAEFMAVRGHPFWGVIYTFNTHPPFRIPEGSPRPFGNAFLNALHYADDSLRVFFEAARTAPYFQNTVFILIADHARTRQTNLTVVRQHHIPLLVYAPGQLAAAVHHVVGSQQDILPTVLGLLRLEARHAAWGRDLFAVPPDSGFAVSVVGNDARWRDDRWLLSNGLTGGPPVLCDLAADPSCKRNVWAEQAAAGAALRETLRSYVSLGQIVFRENRVYPRARP